MLGPKLRPPLAAWDVLVSEHPGLLEGLIVVDERYKRYKNVSGTMAFERGITGTCFWSNVRGCRVLCEPLFKDKIDHRVVAEKYRVVGGGWNAAHGARI
eukprot:Em0007g758a